MTKLGDMTVDELLQSAEGELSALDKLIQKALPTPKDGITLPDDAVTLDEFDATLIRAYCASAWARVSVAKMNARESYQGSNTYDD